MISFAISQWSAWSPGVETKDDWLLWANNQKNIQIDGKPPCDFLPALQRRRLSRLGRMALQVASDCLQDNNVDYIIFSSRHGEPEKTDKMLRGIIESQEVSPTHFSLSVHNTFSGLFSINKKNITPSTAIASGKNTFFSALLEAASVLKTGRAKKVLVVFYDEPLPEAYQAFSDEDTQPFALALILEKSGDDFFDLQFEAKGDASNREWGVLKFFKSFLLKEKNSSYASERLVWNWNRGDGKS